jgi:hypothetical protein
LERFVLELTGGISAVSPFDPTTGTIEISFGPAFQLCRIHGGVHAPEDGDAPSGAVFAKV